MACTQVIFSCFCDRPFSFMFFATLHDVRCFELEEVNDFDLLGMEEGHVHMHLITAAQGGALL